MKRILTITIVALLLLAAFAAGRAAGVHHAIYDAKVWREPGYILLDLEGQIWEYFDDYKEA
jgi:hypothetical protein